MYVPIPVNILTMNRFSEKNQERSEDDGMAGISAQLSSYKSKIYQVCQL